MQKVLSNSLSPDFSYDWSGNFEPQFSLYAHLYVKQACQVLQNKHCSFTAAPGTSLCHSHRHGIDDIYSDSTVYYQ